MNEWVFARKINGTYGSGIINVSTQELLCLCDEENANIILEHLNPQKKYYFITYLTEYSYPIKSHRSKIIDISPMEFLMNKLASDKKVTILNALEISKKQFEKYENNKLLNDPYML